MADIKPAELRSGVAALASRLPQVARSGVSPPPLPATAVAPSLARETLLDPIVELVTDFVAPPRRAASWLSDPRLVATLEAASVALAPDGKAQDPTDRYAASVIETHLVAQRLLTRQTNAMLKT